MKVSKERFKEKLQLYVVESVIPKINGSGVQFLMGAGYGLFEPVIMQKMKDLDMIDGEGNVDMDCLERAVKHGFKASRDKAEFTLMGVKLTFNPSDWSAFKSLF